MKPAKHQLFSLTDGPTWQRRLWTDPSGTTPKEALIAFSHNRVVWVHLSTLKIPFNAISWQEDTHALSADNVSCLFSVTAPMRCIVFWSDSYLSHRHQETDSNASRLLMRTAFFKQMRPPAWGEHLRYALLLSWLKVVAMTLTASQLFLTFSCFTDMCPGSFVSGQMSQMAGRALRCQQVFEQSTIRAWNTDTAHQSSKDATKETCRAVCSLSFGHYKILRWVH